ncbi:MAG: hypothetical protein ACRCVW_04670 [Brevinema sp.]
MKKLLILLGFICMSSQNSLGFAQFNEIYQTLKGSWKSPAEGELTAYFNFLDDGAFVISVVPEFEYEKLSATKQEEIIKQNTADVSGYISILKAKTDLPNREGFGAEVEIYLHEEKTTNQIDITDSKIYMYTTDDTGELIKTVFAEKTSVQDQ